MPKPLRAALGIIIASLLVLVTSHADPTPKQFKLLFSNAQDITNTWGKLHFGATPMQKIRACQDPGFVLACCRPQADGTWEVYGQSFKLDEAGKEYEKKNTWRIVHATTRDAEHFEKVETVFEGEPGCWTPHLGLAFNPDRKEFLMLKLRYDRDGFGYMAFFSPDGRHWQEHPGNPLFRDCDSLGLFWSESARRFICTAKSLQPVPKHYPDHGGTHPNLPGDLRDRRVLCIRSSRDGRQWEPSESLVDVWNHRGNYKSLPAEFLTVPDADDPQGMEFYRGIGFWYHDRSYMVVLNYAASPLLPRKHGPQLDTEWWISRDGLRWDRPYRDINAVGDAFPGVVNITHNPMLIDGLLLFHFGSQLLGVQQDRISYVGARASAEFSTAPYLAPAADLYLNAAVPSPSREFAAPQAYLMAAVLDEHGKVLPGFEAEKCLIQKSDRIDTPLRWAERSAHDLAGRIVSLRFYLRSANIYAVTAK
jgi:hypothetical protein